MKTYIPYSLLAAFAACGMAYSAETAYTTPVGYVSLGNTAPASDAVPASTDMPLSIPLDRTAEFKGLVDSVSGNQVTLQGTPNLTANQFANGTPYIVKIESGASSGLTAIVTANGVSDITVEFQPGDDFVGVVGGDEISVRKAWTISSLFEGATLPDNTEFYAFSGSSEGVNLAPDLLYIYSGGQWFDQGSGEPANNVVVYQGESFVLRNGTATAIASLVVSGEVPTSNSRVRVLGSAGGQDTRIAYVGAVGEPIGSSGLGFNDNDELLVFGVEATGLDNSASTLLIYSGGQWFDQGSGEQVSASFLLEAGQGYVYRTPAGASDSVGSDQPNYVPSL